VQIQYLDLARMTSLIHVQYALSIVFTCFGHIKKKLTRYNLLRFNLKSKSVTEIHYVL